MKSDKEKEVQNYLQLPYTVILRKDSDGDWVGRVDELQGCSAHGRSQAEALENLDEAKRAWIEDALEAGDNIPQPSLEEELPSGKWVQRVPRSLHKKLSDVAKTEGVSLNQLATAMLAEGLGRRNLITEQTGSGCYPMRNWCRHIQLWEPFDQHWHIDQPPWSGGIVKAVFSAISTIPDNTEIKVTRASKKDDTYQA